MGSRRNGIYKKDSSIRLGIEPYSWPWLRKSKMSQNTLENEERQAKRRRTHHIWFKNISALPEESTCWTVIFRQSRRCDRRHVFQLKTRTMRQPRKIFFSENNHQQRCLIYLEEWYRDAARRKHLGSKVCILRSSKSSHLECSVIQWLNTPKVNWNSG